MIKSMTGYSRKEAETTFGTLTIEVKTWNHRHCNVSARIPPLLSQFEHVVQTTVRNRIHRGQAQVKIELSDNDTDSSSHLTFNLALAKQYHQALTEIRNELQLQDEIPLAALARLPGVFALGKPTIDEQSAWNNVQSLLEQTLDGLDQMKRAEGQAMSEAIVELLESIQSHLRKLDGARENLVETAKQRLETRLNELFEGQIEIDKNRLVMEAGVIASRSDVTEELVRLDSHCAQFEGYLGAEDPVGRQLDFLLQEMNREVNTIASKASSMAPSSVCVSLKTEIEKIREIVQNVE
jgi:uncharacterized protein (TIGR00255 family)